MLQNAKALVVVLALALLTFHVCKPIAVQFMREETFDRRRNVWLLLTVSAFLIPNFWIWVSFSAILLIIATRLDANPLGLYCFVMLTVPPVSIYIPAPLINQLFDLSPLRLLALTVVLGALLKRAAPGEQRPGGAFTVGDAALLAFLVLQIALLVPYETVTNTMRRSLLLLIDSMVILYAFSRVRDFARLADIAAALCMAVVVIAPVAVFESLRGWLLYPGIPAAWGDPNVFAFLMRGSDLRAQAATGHSLALGLYMAIGLILFEFVRQGKGGSAAMKLGLFCLMAGALIVSYSRGAWVSAALGLVTYVVCRPDARRHFGRILVSTGLLIVIAFVTPLKEKVIDRLPFIGKTAQDTVDYRQQLAETSWALVDQHPWFGDPFVTLRMESLRQGQGIIDIVNGYLYTALFTGYVGLALQCLLFVLGLLAAWRVLRRTSLPSRERSLVAALGACLVATLLFIATAGHTAVTLIFCGLLFGADRLTRHVSATRMPPTTSAASGMTA